MKILSSLRGRLAAFARRRSRVLSVLAACTLLPLATGGFAAWMFPTSVPVARSLMWLFGAEYLGRDGVIIQQGDADCGIAALQMALAARGVPAAALEDERAAVLQGDTAVSMLYLQRLAAARGVRAVGWRMGLRRLAHAPLPAVVFLGDHFAVVDRVRADGRVEMRDPSLGRVRFTPDDFREVWTGDVLLFPPARPAAHPAPPAAPAAKGAR